MSRKEHKLALNRAKQKMAEVMLELHKAKLHGTKSEVKHLAELIVGQGELRNRLDNLMKENES